MKSSFISITLALVSGLIFGLGLILAGMANPAKVLSFLDLTGEWDPSLAFVMVGAITIGMCAFWWVRNNKSSDITLPDTQHIEWRLMIGASLFGIGWGIAGICPGPAIVLTGVFPFAPQAFLFLVSMLCGMGLFEWMNKRQNP